MSQAVWVGGLEAASAQSQLDVAAGAPALGRRLRARGAATVLVANVPVNGERLHWLDADHARGWLRPAEGQGALPEPRLRQELDAALATGFPAADAAIIACVRAAGIDAPLADTALPTLSWDEQPEPIVVRSAVEEPLGLYAIVDSSPRLQQVLEAKVGTVQLRIKRPPDADAEWERRLRISLEQAIGAARAAGARLFINDHGALAIGMGAPGVHLGQEDLLALGPEGCRRLRNSGVALGISSHSLWELCRARALAPWYIACGPVWPTTTKEMPWRPQGEHNLRWWCRMAGAPVVAIGGVLGAEQVEQAASWGADGVCVVRGLGAQPRLTVPPLLEALERGRRARTGAAPVWLQPTLPPPT